MAGMNPQKPPEIVEPVAVDEVFVTRMAQVENGGGYYRITLTADRAVLLLSGCTANLGDPKETVVKCRLVIPKEDWHRMIRQAIAITGVPTPALGPPDDDVGKPPLHS